LPNRLLEESLANSLVHDDKSDLRGFLLLVFVLRIQIVLQGHDLVQLGQLLVNDLLSHGVTNTVSVDEDMAWHGSIVEVTVAGECSLEVVRQNGGRDDLLAFDGLGAGLRIVLTHVGVVGGAESNSTLLALVTDIDSNEHGLL